MSYILVNLDLLCVNKEINQLITMDHNHPDRDVFLDPLLKQQLIAFVLSRIPNSHVVMDDSCQDPEVEGLQYSCSPEKREHILRLIQEGIRSVAARSEEWIAHHNTQEAYPEYTPSHWFG